MTNTNEVPESDVDLMETEVAPYNFDIEGILNAKIQSKTKDFTDTISNLQTLREFLKEIDPILSRLKEIIGKEELATKVTTYCSISSLDLDIPWHRSIIRELDELRLDFSRTEKYNIEFSDNVEFSGSVSLIIKKNMEHVPFWVIPSLRINVSAHKEGAKCKLEVVGTKITNIEQKQYKVVCPEETEEEKIADITSAVRNEN